MAADFLANHLPPEVAAELDVTTPELVKDSFIDAELQPHFSDLLYRVRLKRGGGAYIYVGSAETSVSTEGKKAMQTMMDVWIQEGKQKSTAALTLRQLQRRIGTVDAETQARIRALPLAQLEQLGEALLDFSQPDGLAMWLREHAPNDSPAITEG